MASHGKELLGDHYGEGYLTYEQIQALGPMAVTEGGEEVPQGEFRGKIFRVEDPDDASGYVVDRAETTGQSATLCYLQRA